MMSMNSKQPFSMHPMLHEPKYAPLHSSSEAIRRACLPTQSLQGNIFAGFDETLLQRAEALAAVDIVAQKSHPFKPDATYHTMTTMTSMTCTPTSSNGHLHHPSVLTSHHHPVHHHQSSQGLDGDLLDHLTPGISLGGMPGSDVCSSASHSHAAHMSAINHMQHHHHQQSMNMHPHGLGSHGSLGGSVGDVEPDPRELESFAERFKQRRIKLGVTQADVGSALANLKIPGVGCLSQSTICRFESLTLSHNNMVALKPILEAWLEEAERAQREKMSKPEIFNGGDKKRKRTSIAAPEKRSLEAYFAVQPRPSSEKIAAIAEKLDLKKNVVRVWFCNQRQKQKRMKFSATH
ncbi:brain-specific homeobox/POU domain protein 3 [Hippoglossus hippoglossus]|uniref:brain-specific homeobox/POU domain protein 3 n=1 Tax=Hippoglossus hippoglossus TaxID=8267 RepID=UPI00148BC147|nr:brain-specific homeobox/POU domain protein 3 [Hippoglossus hippoglossus]XP_034463270.1 brain-specific homeobox/POU domain protein 3 [Hippoglossus hippoglossus]XP_035034735.1 brain-specific homeobox/POU domain protein 3-like [Hippoglossus stenolepis]